MQLLGGDKNVSSSKELINSLQTLKIKSGAFNDLHGSGSNHYIPNISNLVNKSFERNFP